MQPFKPQSHGSAHDPHHGHEEGDVAVNGVLVFLALLAATGIFVFVFSFGLRWALHLAIAHDDQNNQKQTTVWQVADQKKVEEERDSMAKGAPGKPVPTENMLNQRELQQLVNRFPEPRLQTDDAHDMQMMRAHEEIMLHNYMWVDQPGGKVTIPIDRAMEMVVARGLPTVSANTAKPATTKSTTVAPTAVPAPQASPAATGSTPQ